MSKLRVLIVAAALLTAACGATISGSQVKSVSNSSNLAVESGPNAGTDVSGGAEIADLGRGTPTVRQGPAGPLPIRPSPPPGASGTEQSTVGHDRCSNGMAANPGVTPMGGKQPPQPACAVE